MLAEKYRVGRLLGEGGMGLVYLARHVGLDQRVAIKIVRDELAACEDVVTRLIREARTVARLHSEHVARVFDTGRLANGTPYIVMEYLDGCDLDALLVERGALPAERAVDFVLQACEGIAEAHSLGIVHRDLKPENLFLTTRADASPIIKVLDFGISRNAEMTGRSITQPSMVVGSPEFMSPEQMEGAKSCGPASDIWSLGAVLYELVTGCRAFAADSVRAVYAKVLTGEPPPADEGVSLPAGLTEAIHRCLRKLPEERYASIADLARALAPYGPPGANEVAERVARVATVPRARESFDSLVGDSLDKPRPLTPRETAPFATTMDAASPKAVQARARLRVAVWAIATAVVATIAVLVFAERFQATERGHDALRSSVVSTTSVRGAADRAAIAESAASIGESPARASIPAPSAEAPQSRASASAKRVMPKP